MEPDGTRESFGLIKAASLSALTIALASILTFLSLSFVARNPLSVFRWWLYGNETPGICKPHTDTKRIPVAADIRIPTSFITFHAVARVQEVW